MKNAFISLLLLSSVFAHGQQTVRLVKDLSPGEIVQSSHPDEFVRVNGVSFFVGTDDKHGRELWKTDGTEAGTELVKDIYTGPDGSSPFNLTEVGSTLFFAAFDSATQRIQLMKSDGTASGTGRVMKTTLSSFSNFTNVNGTLFFVATFALNGEEIYKSDGTDAGTVILKDINAGTSSSSYPSGLINVNGTLYFKAQDGTNGLELWKSNGTEGGTVMVKDILTTGSANPNDLTDVNGVLFFNAQDGNGRELWKSDGTAAGTVMVKDINTSASSTPRLLTNVNGTLYFNADDGTSGTTLWTSDGTSSGTAMVKSNFPAARIISFKNNAIIASSNELWATDGTSMGTSSIKSSLSVNSDIAVLNNDFYFAGNDGTNGDELWKSDGTSSGTIMVKEIAQGMSRSAPESITNLNGTLFFGADDGTVGQELWSSDGTQNGTQLVKDIRQDRKIGTSFKEFMAVDDQLFFVAKDQLWTSDGRPSNTIELGVRGSNLVNYKDSLFFRGSGTNGEELWKSDGTVNGTVEAVDVVSVVSSSPQDFYVSGGNLYFRARVSGTNQGRELWKTDGTATGTRFLKDIQSGNTSGAFSPMADLNGLFVFIADDGIHGLELWKSDGTSTGTVLLKDIRSGTSSSGIRSSAILGSSLLFAANDKTHGNELWKSDGTEAGTVLVKDIISGGNSSVSNTEIIAFAGAVYFMANDGNHLNGWELWTSDGTESGTKLVKDINPNGPSYIADMVTMGSHFYFVADDGQNGRELWKSDGSASGTVLVSDIATGVASSNPEKLTALNNRLYFTADDGRSGIELWETDGTNSGTQLVKDFMPGAESGFPEHLTVAGDALFFDVMTPGVGRELWRLGSCLETYSTDQINSCGNYQWIDGNTYATSNNTAKVTETNAAGCDSVIYLDLTVNSSTSATDQHTSCGSYTWINSITYSTSNNTATDTLVNAVGCDSIITLDLTITEVDTAVAKSGDMFTANASGASYQWLDCNNSYAPIGGATAQQFTPTQRGSYAVEVTEGKCSDTSSCYSSFLSIDEFDFDGFKIFPNPVNNQITIVQKNSSVMNISIINASGKVVKEAFVADGNIDISNLKNGIYTVRVITRVGIAHKNIIKH